MKERERMEILPEEIRDKVSLVAEGHEVLRREIRQTREELVNRLDNLEVGQFGLNQKIDRVEASLANKINMVHVTTMAINDKLDEHIKLNVKRYFLTSLWLCLMTNTRRWSSAFTLWVGPIKIDCFLWFIR